MTDGKNPAEAILAFVLGRDISCSHSSIASIAYSNNYSRFS
jgi:hypothetical protein